MRSGDYYLPAVALGIAFAIKLPALWRGWREPLIRSVHSVLVTAGACFFLAAPPTISAVNRLTGVPNLSAPLVYCVMGAFSCACLVLIVNWRGGPRERVRRGARRWITAYGVAVVAIPALFALGDAPVERLRDFDTHYATTPFIREMIVIYLVAHIVSAAMTTAMCLHWLKAVRQWLRTGLVVLVAGFLSNLLFGVSKLTAVVARWTGRDWDGLSTEVAPPLAALGGVVTTIGFLLPLVGPRLTDAALIWRTYLRLGPLWRRLRALPGDHPPLPAIPWWAPADLRLTVRETVIHDELLGLHPFLDDRVRRHAHDTALADRATPEQARMAGLAAMLLTAMESRTSAPPPDTGPPSPDDPVAPSGAHALTTALAPGRDRLLLLSHALRSAPPPTTRRGAVDTSGPRSSAGEQKSPYPPTR
ncbi:MAB_1171c family putative transporter [Streptomyces sp. NPDC057638]|uniref:MAB_1171c family putative transporter n=1 Tax=Streptomyces sp. NPDC057638 TaxID=3346190 RepID=UPI003675EBEB